MNELKGTWLKIKTGSDYCEPELIEFEDDQIIHFAIEQSNKKGIVNKKAQEWKEKQSNSKHELVTNNRIRLYRIGQTYTEINYRGY